MAIIQFTAAVSDIRNSLSGTTFSKNRYGSYIRTKVTPSNPSTPGQANIRSIFGSTSSQWRGLTEAQRSSWIGAAPDFPVIDQFGNSHILAGNALFNRLNSTLGAYELSQIVDPPAPEAVTEFKISLLEITNTPLLFRVSVTEGFFNANDIFAIYTTAPYSPGQSYFKNRLRLTSFGTNAAGGTQVFTITTNYQDKFGDPIIGKKIGIGVLTVNIVTGQKSPMQTGQVLVAS